MLTRISAVVKWILFKNQRKMLGLSQRNEIFFEFSR